MTRSIQLFNTASLEKEEFKAAGTVGMYCCGPTVYNYAHVGNMRAYLFEDILKRALLAAGFSVKHVVNITDVGHLTDDADTGDDKMELATKRENKSVWEIAAFYTQKFMEDVTELNILTQDIIWPKATDHIAEMIAMVKTLEDKGFTYATGDGIYFDTAKFPDYVKFARLDPEGLEAGSRIDMGEKRSLTDFALWKFSPKNVQRAMEWDSPWGKGFPGWHIECSAMSLKYLTQPLDIHCGGADHIRIHHTNEIAQVEAATGKQYCRHWCHNEWLVMDKGEKMSKSKGLFVTLASLKAEGISPLALRLFMFSAHYRSPLRYSRAGVESAQQSYKSLVTSVTSAIAGDAGIAVAHDRVETILSAFYEAVMDDLNMPRAMAALWDIIKDAALSPAEKRAAIAAADGICGLDLLKAAAAGSASLEKTTPEGAVVRFGGEKAFDEALVEKILAVVDMRKAAKAAKDWAKSDALRDELAALGVVAKDMKDGSTECVLS